MKTKLFHFIDKNMFQDMYRCNIEVFGIDEYQLKFAMLFSYNCQDGIDTVMVQKIKYDFNISLFLFWAFMVAQVFIKINII